jgi:hypothetical protein
MSPILCRDHHTAEPNQKNSKQKTKIEHDVQRENEEWPRIGGYLSSQIPQVNELTMTQNWFEFGKQPNGGFDERRIFVRAGWLTQIGNLVFRWLITWLVNHGSDTLISEFIEQKENNLKIDTESIAP